MDEQNTNETDGNKQRYDLNKENVYLIGGYTI